VFVRERRRARSAVSVLALLCASTARAQVTVGVIDEEERAREQWCAPVAARSAGAVDSTAMHAGSYCLSGGDRLRLLARLAIDPLFYGQTLVASGWDQWRRDPPQWGRTLGGFGHRAGATAGAWVVYAGVESGVAALMDVDPRPTFAPLAEGRPSLRTVLLNATTLRRRDGTRMLALPRVLGAGASAWAYAWYRPERPSARRVAGDVLENFGASVATHVIAEYWRSWRARRR
jgi:hypothetical protein